MKNGLMIVGKDVDAYLANHINNHFKDSLHVDIVVLKHRDKLEFETKFPHIKCIYSLPEFYSKSIKELSCLSVDDIVGRIDSYSEVYKLRSINQYIHYDFFRTIKKDVSLKANYIRILAMLNFFKSIDITSYDFSYGELSRSYYVMCYDIMKGVGKPYLSPTNIGVFKGVLYVDDKFKILNFDAKKQQFETSESREDYLDKARTYINDFCEKPKYNYAFLTTNFSNNIKKLSHVFRKLKNLPLEVKAYPIDSKYRFDFIQQNPITRVFTREILSVVKSKLVKLLFFRKCSLEHSRYVFFPLHVHPETTTSLFSEFQVGHLTQHLETIENLSKSMPAHNKLLVKEHPAMIGDRPLMYYSKYRQFYNVDLVGPEVNQYDALDKSEFVITLCGTVGIEALMKGVRVITLGNTYYNYFKGVKYINSTEDYVTMFDDTNDFKTNHAQLAEDLAFLMYCTHFGVINFLIDNDSNVISKKNLDLFAESMLEELNTWNITSR